jgi:hypothetical protein
MEDYKIAGSVWETRPKPQRKAADFWLTKHADYERKPTAASSVSDSGTRQPSAGMEGAAPGSRAQQTAAHRPAPSRGNMSHPAPPPGYPNVNRGVQKQREIIVVAEKPPRNVALPDGITLLNVRQANSQNTVAFQSMKQAVNNDAMDIHEIRPGFTDTRAAAPLTVLTSHFRVDISRTTLHKYFVSVKTSDDDEGDGSGAPGGKRQERLSWFIDNCNYLKGAKQHFANDSLAIIIPWKELGELKRGSISKEHETLDHQKRIIRAATALPNGKVLERYAEQYTADLSWQCGHRRLDQLKQRHHPGAPHFGQPRHSPASSEHRAFGGHQRLQSESFPDWQQ